MAQKTHSLAFLGVAHIHAPSFLKTAAARPDVKITAVWDDDFRRSTHWAKHVGAAPADDIDSAIAAADAIVITSETAKHATLVAKATAARKPLFLDKPLATSAKDAAAMAAQIEQAGVLFQTGYFQRSEAVVREVKRLIDTGALGKVTKATASKAHRGALDNWFKSKPDAPHEDWHWMTDPAQAGVGAFGDLGSHELDILLWWLGDVTRVTAQVDPVTHTYRCDESGQALLRFATGPTATLSAGWVDVADPVRYTVSGTQGHAAVIGNRLFVTQGQQAKFDLASPVANLPPNAPHAFELFLDAVAGKPLPIPLVTAREAAYSSTVMAALYEAAQNHTWVTPRK